MGQDETKVHCREREGQMARKTRVGEKNDGGRSEGVVRARWKNSQGEQLPFKSTTLNNNVIKRQNAQKHPSK